MHSPTYFCGTENNVDHLLMMKPTRMPGPVCVSVAYTFQ